MSECKEKNWQSPTLKQRALGIMALSSIPLSIAEISDASGLTYPQVRNIIVKLGSEVIKSNSQGRTKAYSLSEKEKNDVIQLMNDMAVKRGRPTLDNQVDLVTSVMNNHGKPMFIREISALTGFDHKQVKDILCSKRLSSKVSRTKKQGERMRYHLDGSDLYISSMNNSLGDLLRFFYKVTTVRCSVYA